MARIDPVTEYELNASVQVALERYSAAGYAAAAASNTKSTLAHSLAALEVYVKLDPLFEELKKILGAKQAALYGYNISLTTGCSLCAAYFRKILTEQGLYADAVYCLTEKEKQLVNFGNAVAKYHGHIANHVYNELAAHFSKKEMVVLIAFAGQLIAVTIFNNTVETEMDEHLVPYALK